MAGQAGVWVGVEGLKVAGREPLLRGKVQGASVFSYL